MNAILQNAQLLEISKYSFDDRDENGSTTGQKVMLMDAVLYEFGRSYPQLVRARISLKDEKRVQEFIGVVGDWSLEMYQTKRGSNFRFLGPVDTSRQTGTDNV